ncbi:TolC family protein [Aquincola tertiaricarbonis]|uniref:TolC family protein n=1 Tax=Aquincola tertiaricarbonis TaxID=391953 RepID=A0ABY4S6C3_AQUTE|nr:TolC family protein [Aquincola tertiaricarbonis]URI08539.1 TolC family protein [Aquincola tertiaricarbonis]
MCLPALMAGCTLPPLQPPAPAEVPPDWATPRDRESPAADLQGWWKDWNDPLLDQLVAQALQANPELLMATSRVRQARLLAGSEAARWRPSLAFGVHPMSDAKATDSFVHVGVDASWEPGLFGMAEASRAAAAGQQAKAQWAEQAARVMVVAETVRQYLGLRAAQQQALAQEQLVALETDSAALAQVRMKSRLAPAAERLQADQRVAQARAAAAEQRGLAQASAQALALLIGRSRPDPAWLQPATVPQPAPRSLQALPATVLLHRPDVRAAEESVRIAAGEAGMSQAEMAPRIVLGAGVLRAWNVTQRGQRPTHALASLAPTLDLPLFDWDLRRDRALAAQEHVNEALLDQRRTVLVAVAEVESALDTLQMRRDRRQALAEAAQAQQRLLQQQAVQQRLGLSGDADQLALRRTQLLAEAELAQADAGSALALVSLYRAVGGAPLPQGLEATP